MPLAEHLECESDYESVSFFDSHLDCRFQDPVWLLPAT